MTSFHCVITSSVPLESKSAYKANSVTFYFNSIIIMMVIIAECVRVFLVSPTFCNLFTLIFLKSYVSFISTHVSIILKSAFSLP